MLKIKKVEKPEFQTMRQIAEKYIGNWVLITNKSNNPLGGIVRYYSLNKSDGLWDIIIDMDKDFETYGECDIRSVIRTDASFGGLGL